MGSEYIYSTELVCNISGASKNQLKYWVKCNILFPERQGRAYYYSFRELIKVRLIVSLKNKGLSFQKIKKGLVNLMQGLPESESVLSKLVIYTDGTDMIVTEKGQYFSAITKQQYIKFDTEELSSEIIQLVSRSGAGLVANNRLNSITCN